MRGFFLAALVASVALAGCVSSEPALVPPVDSVTILQGVVIHGDTEDALPGVALELTYGNVTLEDTTGADGKFRFTITVPSFCELDVQKPEFSSGTLDLDCRSNRQLTVRLHPIIYEDPRAPAPPVVEDVPLIPAEPADPIYALHGQVMGIDGPVGLAQVVLVGSTTATAIADATGEFEFAAPSGNYSITASAPCLAPATRSIEVDDDTSLTVLLSDGDRSPPGAPQTVQTQPGPGIRQTTIHWQPPADHGGAPVSRYIVYRDGQPFAHMGNALAYGDTGAALTGHEYAVSAINGCDIEGAQSAAVSGIPIPGELVTSSVSGAGFSVGTHTYDVLDANGNKIGTRDWRTTNAVGNCCETFVTSDSAGNLYEYGGSNLYVSANEGISWSRVSNTAPVLGAEGAITPATGGDMLAVNWDPYTGDQLWTHKYVAATGTWYTARTPIHQPVFDREWISVIEGPFDVDGVIVPYVSFIMSGYVHGDILYLSLDGLYYQTPSTRLLTQLGGTQAFPSELPPDPDRDWMQSNWETQFYPVDNGFGLRDRAILSTCDMAVLGNHLQWGCPSWGTVSKPPTHGEILRVDSDGNLHIFSISAGDREFNYRFSDDLGTSWDYQTARIPDNMVIEDWDARAHAALDQAVVAIHASESSDQSTRDADFLFRFTGFHDGPELAEILQVGQGDHVFGGGLTSAYDRFDYTTVTLLASGAVALSFGDSIHAPPGIAIEIPGSGQSPTV